MFPDTGVQSGVKFIETRLMIHLDEKTTPKMAFRSHPSSPSVSCLVPRLGVDKINQIDKLNSLRPRSALSQLGP